MNGAPINMEFKKRFAGMTDEEFNGLSLQE